LDGPKLNAGATKDAPKGGPSGAVYVQLLMLPKKGNKG
jgi:hypothetical protein